MWVISRKKFLLYPFLYFNLLFVLTLLLCAKHIGLPVFMAATEVSHVELIPFLKKLHAKVNSYDTTWVLCALHSAFEAESVSCMGWLYLRR